jgi:hypothetical protein
VEEHGRARAKPTIFEAAVAHQHVHVCQLALALFRLLVLVDLCRNRQGFPSQGKDVVGLVRFNLLLAIGGASSRCFFVAFFFVLFPFVEERKVRRGSR